VGAGASPAAIGRVDGGRVPVDVLDGGGPAVGTLRLPERRRHVVAVRLRIIVIAVDRVVQVVLDSTVKEVAPTIPAAATLTTASCSVTAAASGCITAGGARVLLSAVCRPLVRLSARGVADSLLEIGVIVRIRIVLEGRRLQDGPRRHHSKLLLLRGGTALLRLLLLTDSATRRRGRCRRFGGGRSSGGLLFGYRWRWNCGTASRCVLCRGHKGLPRESLCAAIHHDGASALVLTLYLLGIGQLGLGQLLLLLLSRLLLLWWGGLLLLHDRQWLRTR